MSNTNDPKNIKLGKFDFPDQFLKLWEPTTKVEARCLKFYRDIISKKGWEQMIKDENIVAKWKKELWDTGFHYEEDMIKWELDKLTYLSSQENVSRIIPVTDMVCQVEHMIPKNLKESFLSHTKPLENDKNWRAKSRSTVLNLLHPDLWCLINGQSYVTEEPMKQRDVPVYKWGSESQSHLADFEKIYADTRYKEEISMTINQDRTVILEPDFYMSKRFQWLPSDVYVSEDGTARFDSYINGLHPIEHKKLYRDLEQIFELFIPMFERVLTDVLHPNSKWFDSDDSQKLLAQRWDFFSQWHYDEEPKRVFEKVFSPVKDLKDQQISLKGRKLQVICKITNIELTPENFDSPGSSVFHPEGTRNEDIIATGLYYYSVENILGHGLGLVKPVEQVEVLGEFPKSTRSEIFDQGYKCLLREEVADLYPVEDRCYAFSNYMQHRVSGTGLRDWRNPGHVKVLAFFLINPDHERVSTSRVLPQITSWMAPVLKQKNVLGDILPDDVIDIILEFSPHFMSLDQAKKIRLDFIAEREQLFEEEGSLLCRRLFNMAGNRKEFY